MRGLAALVAAASTLAFAASVDAAWPGRNGAIVFVGEATSGGWAGRAGIWKLDLRQRRRLRSHTADPTDRHPAISPDGRTIAFTRVIPGSPGVFPTRAIFTVPYTGGAVTQVTDGLRWDTQPAFTRSGRRILFSRSQSLRDGDADIYSVAVEGGPVRQLTSGPQVDIGAAVSPRGNLIAFARQVESTRLHVFTMRPDGSRLVDATPRLARGQSASEPDFSPSGRRIAFTISEGGRRQLYTMRPDGRGIGRLTVRRRCGRCRSHLHAAFSPNGRAIAMASAKSDTSRLAVVRLGQRRSWWRGLRLPVEAMQPVWQPLPAGGR